jgi:hypothetical protein
LAGDSTQAARLASDLSKRFLEDTMVQSQYLPMIHACVALRNADSITAADVLAAASP